MPSTPRLVHEQPGTLVLAVDHDPGTSFSRSVDPTATRYWNRHAAPSGVLTASNRADPWHRRTAYCPDDLTPSTPGRACRTLVVFTTDALPDAVLDTWHRRLAALPTPTR